MVTSRIVLTVAAGLGLGACNWSVFSDLADESWVDRVERPDGTESRQYGEAIVATPTRTAGTNLVVIGKSRASISQLGYDGEGNRLAINPIDPRQPLSFASFPDNPALAVDDDTDRIAFTVVQGENVDPTRIAVYNGASLADTPLKSVILSAQVNVDGVMRHDIYAEGVTFANLPGFGDAGEDELVVARGPQIVVIQDYLVSETQVGTTFALLGCTTGRPWSYAIAVDNVIDDNVHAGPELVVAVGEERRTPDPAQILILDPAQITTAYDAPANCMANVPALATISSTEMAPDLGSQIVTAQFPDVVDTDPSYTIADLIYSAPSINKVFVRFGNGSGTEINPGTQGSDFGDAITTGDIDGDGMPELIIGAPKSDPDGVTNGGQVFVYKFNDNLTSPGFDLAMTLHPASPDPEEHFGKSVAVAPFGTGTDAVLMIGGEGEVFTYFRTMMYDDVRTGR